MTIDMLPAEQARRLHNASRVGVVEEVDTVKARAKVRIGDNLTAWVPWLAARAGGNRTWSAPDIGEQVLLNAPGGDLAAAVIVGAIYQASAAAPADSADIDRTVYQDGAVVEYDRSGSVLTATLPAGGTVNVTCPGGLTLIAAGGVQITGDTTVTGSLTVAELITAQQGISTAGGGGATITVTGNIDITGTVTSGGDQVAGGISQIHHVHGGIVRGGANTDEPQ